MSPQSRTHPAPTIVVVDPSIEDYDTLVTSRPAHHRRILSAGTGEAALRLPVPPNAVWLVNVDLPDMKGADLMRVLRTRTDRPTVCLIGNAYDDEDELAARLSGAAIYLCKPLSPKWFRHLADLAGKREGLRFELEPRPPTDHEAA